MGAVKNKWHMLGTESDLESFSKAEENIQKNNLQELIKCKYRHLKFIFHYLMGLSHCLHFNKKIFIIEILIFTLILVMKNNTKSVITHVFTSQENEKFDFCMCNPPFYSNLQELCESRSPARYFIIIYFILNNMILL